MCGVLEDKERNASRKSMSSGSNATERSRKKRALTSHLDFTRWRELVTMTGMVSLT